MLFYLCRFSSIPWHCSSVHVSFAFLVPFFKLPGWFLCKNFALSAVFFFCFSSLRLFHSFSMLSVNQGFFAGRCLSWLLLAVSDTAVLKLLIKVSNSVSWLSRTRSGANFPPIVARKMSVVLGSLSFSRLNLILTLPWFFILWRRSLKVIITHGHFRYQLLESSWSLRCSNLTGSVVWPWCSRSDCGILLLGCAMSSV